MTVQVATNQVADCSTVICMCCNHLNFTFSAFDAVALHYNIIISLFYFFSSFIFCFINVSNIEYCIDNQFIEPCGFSGSLLLLLLYFTLTSHYMSYLYSEIVICGSCMVYEGDIKTAHGLSAVRGVEEWKSTDVQTLALPRTELSAAAQCTGHRSHEVFHDVRRSPRRIKRHGGPVCRHGGKLSCGNGCSKGSVSNF